MGDFDEARAWMVERQIVQRGVRDDFVIEAMRRVPREAFVPPDLRDFAYDDTPLPIGGEQSISQPYIVAKMLAAAELQPGDRVLDIGTGSGYAAAIAAEIAGRVDSIERDARASPRAPASGCSGSATRMSKCMSATAPRVLPRMRRITRSSRRRAGRVCRRRCACSLRSAVGS
ncbi:SAM-dependent methyltransferase [Paraburkholderia youngii]